ncbi:MAG: hypothetical protein KF832_07755, partial [Caldilineaceae bacterium]|nr:hypothetical protein [Caldilineaceae bacterium]
MNQPTYTRSAPWGKWRQRLIYLVSLLLLTILISGYTLTLYAAEVEVGYSDFGYPSGTGAAGAATAEKPESKLWWNDGAWWASMWSTAGNAYHIYKLNWNTQVWSDTGVKLDDRKGSLADALWDGNKLYVVSHIWSASSKAASAGQEGRLYRYSYSNGVYSLDANFPVNVNNAVTESLVLVKDSTGTLWVTYTYNKKLWVNRSQNGNDATWGTPYVLPVGTAATVDTDDLSSIVAYNGHIGIMWSNQTSGVRMYFAAHADGAGDSASDWQVVAAYTVSGDDHINLKALHSDAAGNLFAVVKTSFSITSNPPKPYIVVLACTAGDCTAASDWSAHVVFMTNEGNPTRPMLLIDTSNRELYVFTRVRYSGNNDGIYYKKSSIDNINFPSNAANPNIGIPFIKDSTYTGLNDPTSTKQNVNSTTGLVVLASDSSKRYYLHNCLSLSAQSENCAALEPGTSTPTATATNTAAPTATPTATATATFVPATETPTPTATGTTVMPTATGTSTPTPTSTATTAGSTAETATPTPTATATTAGPTAATTTPTPTSTATMA